ncbi:HAD-IIA family hydrolase [Thiolapillus sp.]
MTSFLLDMDGILYHGDHPLPGAVEFVEELAAHPHLFITNNPIRTPEEVAGKLRSMGFLDICADRILTSAQATALWLERQQPGFRYFAVGGAGLDEALARKGQQDEEKADFVVVGEGPGLDYDSLTTGINLILGRGARLVSTNPDTTVDAWRDGHHLVLPGGGALVAPFEAATGRKAVTIGKPESLLYEMAMERLGTQASDCIMIGDRPDTDIAGAAALGMSTAMVRTGRFPPGAPWPGNIPTPDWDLDSLPALALAFRQAGLFPDKP